MELRTLMASNSKLTQFLPVLAYITGPVLSLVSLPLITSSIKPSDYGAYSYYLSVISYIVLISFFPSLNSTVLRFLNRDFNSYISDRNTLVIGSIISTSLYWILCSILFYFINDILLIYLCVCYFVINVFTLYKSFLNTNGEKKVYSVALLFVTISQYLLLFFLYFTKTITLYHLLLGNLVSSILVLILILLPKIRNRSWFKLKLEKQIWITIMI